MTRTQGALRRLGAAKTLAAAVVVGGTMLAGGTSFAAGTLRDGAAVTATGAGATAEAAENDATSRAAAE